VIIIAVGVAIPPPRPQPERRSTVIEVIGQGEREHYRIRWQDGHESVYFPGPDARVVSAG
jgi:hypothetical protein